MRRPEKSAFGWEIEGDAEDLRENAPESETPRQKRASIVQETLLPKTSVFYPGPPGEERGGDFERALPRTEKERSSDLRESLLLKFARSAELPKPPVSQSPTQAQTSSGGLFRTLQKALASACFVQKLKKMSGTSDKRLETDPPSVHASTPLKANEGQSPLKMLSCKQVHRYSQA
ncbi:unnamed protein product [Polarella glacialis]|uniref:Uncharacterized protein n=1 Tax=Polarella glacialis TaxID=89957 RepID=A0A813GIK4_POLGL|nr:unnamed protein product [Polarella glacialis]